jgi:phenylacetate-CoA ligase
MSNRHKRQIERFRRQLEHSQWWSVEKLKEIQERKLRELSADANLHCKYYTDLFDQAGIDPSQLSVRKLAQLPITDKQDIRENFEHLINGSFARAKLLERSSGGSTGEPIHVLRTEDSFIIGKAIKQRNYSWLGWQPGDRHHWFWGAYFDAPNKAISERFDAWIYNQRFVNAFSLSEDLLESYYNIAASEKPYLLESYSNILYEFARFIRKTHRAHLDIPAVISSAGKLFDFQRELIVQTVSKNVFDRYGCRELDNIAQECDVHSGLHVNMERYIVEIESPDEEGFGDVIVTDLANRGFPLIRYRIQDRGRLSDRKCACGRGLILLDEIEGRSVDTVRTPSGKIISGALFPQLFIRYPEIIMGQVVQHKLDDIEALIRVETGPSAGMLDALKKSTCEYLSSMS